MHSASHKRSKDQVLFRGPELMVMQEKTENGALLFLRSKNGFSTPLERDAASLLIDYLRVGKAFFAGCQQSRKLLAQQHASLVASVQELRAEGPLQRPMISEVIAQLGCVTDWRQEHPQNFL